jgi:hypothetical protein
MMQPQSILTRLASLNQKKVTPLGGLPGTAPVSSMSNGGNFDLGGVDNYLSGAQNLNPDVVNAIANSQKPTTNTGLINGNVPNNYRINNDTIPTASFADTQVSPEAQDTTGYSPSDIGVSSTSTGTSSSSSSTPMDGSFDPLQRYQDLALEKANHSSQGTGLYALRPGVQYSPDQIMSQRKSADAIYDQRLSEYANLAHASIADAKSKSSELDTSSYSPLLKSAANLVSGNSIGERRDRLSYLSTLPESQQLGEIQRDVYNKLPAGARQTFDDNENISSSVNYLLQQKPADLDTDPYKYQGEKYIKFLGNEGDPKYQTYQSMIGRITAPIINNIYGAAVTGGELDRAKTFIPNLATDSTQSALVKLANLSAFSKFANDAMMYNHIRSGERPKLEDYLPYDSNGKPKKGFDYSTGKTKSASSNSSNPYAESWD